MSKTIPLICAIVIFLTPLSSQAATRLLINCFFPPQHFVCTNILPAWKEDVESATQGRVRVAFLPKSMAPPPDQLSSVRNGVFDGAIQFNGFISSEVTGALVSMMPFTGTSSSRANSIAMWRTYERYLSDIDEFEGVKLLGFLVAPGADFYSLNDRPIRSKADLVNRKMWALPGVTSSLLKQAGGAVVSGPAVQMTEMIQRGVVDGFVGVPASDAKAFNVLQYAQSTTRTKRKIFTPSFSFFISDAKWDRISAKDRKEIMAVSGNAFAEMAGSVWGKIEAKVVTAMKDQLSVIDATDQFERQLEDGSQDFIDRWLETASAKNFDAAKALDFYEKTSAELAKQ